MGNMGNMGNMEPWGETWPVHLLGLWVPVLSEMTLAYLRSIPMDYTGTGWHWCGTGKWELWYLWR